MRQKSHATDLSSEEIVKDIRRATRKRYSAEEKIRIVLDGLRGEHSIAELCRREGIAEGLYYSWSKEFLEAGKRRLAGDTARAATSDEVKDLKRQARELKEVVAEQALELRLLKKSMIADGGRYRHLAVGANGIRLRVDTAQINDARGLARTIAAKGPNKWRSASFETARKRPSISRLASCRRNRASVQ